MSPWCGVCVARAEVALGVAPVRQLDVDGERHRISHAHHPCCRPPRPRRARRKAIVPDPIRPRYGANLAARADSTGDRSRLRARGARGGVLRLGRLRRGGDDHDRRRRRRRRAPTTTTTTTRREQVPASALEKLVLRDVSGFKLQSEDIADTGPTDLNKAALDDVSCNVGCDARQELTSAGFVDGYQRPWTSVDETGSTVNQDYIYLYEFESPEGARQYAQHWRETLLTRPRARRSWASRRRSSRARSACGWRPARLDRCGDLHEGSVRGAGRRERRSQRRPVGPGDRPRVAAVPEPAVTPDLRARIVEDAPPGDGDVIAETAIMPSCDNGLSGPVGGPVWEGRT